MIKSRTAPNYEARTNAFTYQLAAVQAIQDKPFAAVFHEQGLGKTKIAIDLALHWLSTNILDSVIITTKRSLISNWANEIHIHSHINPRMLTQDRKANYYAFNSAARIYLTHYEVLVSERKRLDLFLRTRQVGIILDESQKIKNPEATVSRALHGLSPLFVRKLIMTGTPIANRPYDLWSQVYFLDQGNALGSNFREFKSQLDLHNDLFQDDERRRVFEEALGTVYQRIESFAVRETKASTGILLPEKMVKNHFVALESRQLDIYNAYKRELGSVILKNGVPVYDSADDVLKRLLRLVQIASNPSLVDSSYKRDPGKIRIAEDLIGNAVDAGEKVIIWTSFVENADWLARRFDTFGAVKVHGKIDYASRDRSLQAFRSDPGVRVLVATPASAKEGLTLTSANHAIFFDRSFSLDDYLQAQDRIHRISQTRPCFVHNMIAKWSIDEWVDQLLLAKQIAAQFGQGDISRSEFERDMKYDFAQMLREVLGGGE